jgi:hypothetical protein
MMLLGAHWAYWAGLAVAILAGALDLVRRARRRERVFFAALLEQGRRELEVEQRSRRLRYRPDQSVRAVQQRLSRSWGKRAYSEKVRLRIVRALGLAD